MQKSKINILSTKMLLPASKELAMEFNISITEKEFISIKPINSKEVYDEIMAIVENKNVSNIVFTSANAVDTVITYLHQGDTYYVPNWNIFCLSGKTKDAIKPHISEKKIVAIADNASGLSQKIIDSGVKEAVFFCGNKRRNDLPDTLKKSHVKLKEIIVYETAETSKPLTKNFDAVLFFSPSAVNSFFSANQLNKKTVCFAIGNTTAAAIESYTGNKIIASESPTQERVLAEVNFYFENINCY